MNASTRFALASAVLLAAVPTVMQAHFKLMEPASWIVEDDRGDPQKAGPCGGTTPTTASPPTSSARRSADRNCT